MTTPAKDDAPQKNLYEVLGAAKDEDQHGISKKYKKLALKYHPDRNRGEGQEAAAAAFREVSDAYAVLSDPNKRRQYDLHGDEGLDAAETNAFESVDVKSQSWASRFLLAQVSKLGVPIPTTVAADVLSKACELAEAELQGVAPLKAGVAATGSLKISEAAFFRVRVDAATAKAGLVLAARSRRKNDKFRLLVFDERGGVRRQAESLFPERGDRRRGAASRCRLFVVPVPTLLVGAPFSMATEEHLPLVCAALDTLEERPAAAPPFETGDRDYLVAIWVVTECRVDAATRRFFCLATVRSPPRRGRGRGDAAGSRYRRGDEVAKPRRRGRGAARPRRRRGDEVSAPPRRRARLTAKRGAAVQGCVPPRRCC
mmetsp:Transcript_13862/g.42977  ORF Transcript_13862/g.42977 Transcript_13862/m.42977 type:complete len:371 (-) Transcript_13862:60-1172(-)